MNTELKLKRMLLLSIFRKFNINTNMWGTGSAKTLDDLIHEIDNDETVLQPEGSILMRHVTVLYVDVTCFVGGCLRTLHEDRQVFADGRVRRRTLAASLAEKLTAREAPDEASVARALAEELDLPKAGIKKLHFITSWTEQIDSPSYPGLVSKFTNHKVVVEIGKSYFQPAGHREVQPTKTTYFVWR